MTLLQDPEQGKGNLGTAGPRLAAVSSAWGWGGGVGAVLHPAGGGRVGGWRCCVHYSCSLLPLWLVCSTSPQKSRSGRERDQSAPGAPGCTQGTADSQVCRQHRDLAGGTSGVLLRVTGRVAFPAGVEGAGLLWRGKTCVCVL